MTYPEPFPDAIEAILRLLRRELHHRLRVLWWELFTHDLALDHVTEFHGDNCPIITQLSKEIRREMETLANRCKTLHLRGERLRNRRIARFSSEKQAYNRTVEAFLPAYEAKLRELNRKIMNLNLIAPPVMHRATLDVDAMLNQLQNDCPPLI